MYIPEPGHLMLKLEITTCLITTLTHALIQTYSITFYQQCWWILGKEKKSKNRYQLWHTLLNTEQGIFVLFLTYVSLYYNVWLFCSCSTICIIFEIYVSFFLLLYTFCVIVVAGNTVNKCKDLASKKSIPGKRLMRMLWI